MSAKRILIVAGGTGGHVFPGLAVAKMLIEQGHEVFWVGTRRGIESKLIPESNIKIEYIDIEGIRGKKALALIKAPWLISRAILQALKIIKRLNVDAVLCMGGFVSGPVGIAAKIGRIPLIIHEQNAIAGTTNRILSKVANVNLQAFPQAISANAITVGNPVRATIYSYGGDHLPRDEERLQVLIVGGSLGAEAINQLIPEVCDSLGDSLSIWHQVGDKHYTDMMALYATRLPSEHIRVSPFIREMDQAYEFADIVICRSGAMTVSELAAAGKPAIFVPFPYAIDDHQTANARWLSDSGAAILVQQSELSVHWLIDKLRYFHQNRMKLRVMQTKVMALAKPNATGRVVGSCLEVAL